MKPYDEQMPPPPDEAPPDDRPTSPLDTLRTVADQAEAATLGALLIGGDVDACAAQIADDVDAWGRPAHRLVWDAITDVHGAGGQPDTVAVLDRIRRGGHVDTIGGPAALADLAAAAPAASQAHLWAEKVAEAAQRRRAYRAAQRLLRDVQDPSQDPWDALHRLSEVADGAAASSGSVPAGRPLGEFLAEPDPEVTWRVADLWPAYGNAVLSAAYKAGKSTTVGNVLRSLVDGEPMFGRYEVNPPRGRVGLIDDELHDSTLRRWLRDQGIDNTDAVHVWPLKGQVGTFDVFSARGRAAWAAELRRNNVTVLVVDCLRPILDAFGMDENHEMGQLLQALETLAHDAGIDELLVIHHQGHDAERPRGDSRVRDWPDVEWTLVRQSKDRGSPRYFSAYGRDVDEPEQLLELEPDGRRLTIVGGTRREQAVSDLVDVVLEVVADRPGVGARDIREHVRELADGATNADVDKARRRAVEKGLVEVRQEGTKHAHHPIVPSVPDRAEALPAHPPDDRAAVPVGGTAREGTHDGAPERAVPSDGTARASCDHDPDCTAEVEAHGPDGRTWCRTHVPWEASA